ncbi:benzoylformate decarboxylase [Metarhizium robertsii ARSEF 23]|nr:benzoylformate decarboxylase [Metarhizium robertsii ARSEF 23]EFY94488.1 benzoylformate decarboxylase [Metarhizium robertsii ARSEF 23]
MADGFSQATRKPVLVSLHTSAGTGNGMGNIMTAFLNKTPLVIIAGQQTRDMLIGEPMLTNRDAATMPKPWVKWSFQPDRAQDVPAALIRAIATATMPPAGPVYLSIPMDDWDAPMPSIPAVRTVSTRIAPDPKSLSLFASRIQKASSFALILGQEVDRSLGWEAAVKLAEFLNSPVFQAPLSERAVFPERHRLFCGSLPMAKGPLAKALQGFDVVFVVGAEVWRYYPYIPGRTVPDGLKVLHVTNDPHDAATALVGDSLLSDANLALEGLYALLYQNRPPQFSAPPWQVKPAAVPSHEVPTAPGMSAMEAWSSVAKLRPPNAILVQESPSNGMELVQVWPAEQAESYFTFASGGLGWNAPAAVGIALAQKFKATGRPTILAIGDGSLHYSVQSIYTAVQHSVKLVFLVPVNQQYAILKQFAILEQTPNVPALDLPGLDASAVAKAYGCAAFRAETEEELQSCFSKALSMEGPVLIEFPVHQRITSLI